MDFRSKEKKAELFDSIFTSANIGILLVDTQRNILEVNSEMTKILGYNADELIGMNGEDLSVKDDDGDSKEMIEEAVTNKHINFAGTKRYIHKNGNIVHCELSVSLSKDASYFIIFVKDVSKRIEQEKKLNELTLTLKEAVATKNKIFSIISHDLINPVGSIANLSRELYHAIHDYSKQELELLLKGLYKASKNSYNLLSDLLLWSNEQSGKLILKPEKLEIKTLVADAVKVLQSLAEQKEIAIINNVKTDCKVLADKYTFSVIIRNLLSNAIKFTHGKGEITLECVQGYDNHINPIIELAFRDTGIGIPEDKIKNLFNLNNGFIRTGTYQEKGTGLGLQLCSDFIQLNNGNIRVESEVNKGTIFYLTLPASF